ncbi:hypothetical protein LTR37_010027 [Vermiconidia calcicola]|uniref:Uncharacterized protein n=1 Tax=Vermiconidia calcicola TaxID=1690605 RepID=A0ACC3N660_9PEZI|nr:hypothetical protein LTR37_010027 [Vermiconidia calcicola]
MSASVEEAAHANADLSPAAGSTRIKPAEGYGTMKAGSWDPVQRRVVVRDVPVPEPGPNQFLVKTATLGHEGAGYIEKMHSSVESKGYKKGDPVGFFGKQLLQGFTTDGFFAEYAVVDEPNCIHLPAAIDVRTAAVIFCAGITAFHAVDSSELREGDWLAVVGAGGLGQIATQIAKARGCKLLRSTSTTIPWKYARAKVQTPYSTPGQTKIMLKR